MCLFQISLCLSKSLSLSFPNIIMFVRVIVHSLFMVQMELKQRRAQMSFDCQFQQWHTLNMRLVKWRGNMVPILMISKVFLVSTEPPSPSSSCDNRHHHYHGLTPKNTMPKENVQSAQMVQTRHLVSMQKKKFIVDYPCRLTGPFLCSGARINQNLSFFLREFSGLPTNDILSLSNMFLHMFLKKVGI